MFNPEISWQAGRRHGNVTNKKSRSTEIVTFLDKRQYVDAPGWGIAGSGDYLELVLLVFGALVEGPIVSEPPDVIELVEALDVVGHAVALQHVLALGDRRHGVDLQVWKRRLLRETTFGRKSGNGGIAARMLSPQANLCRYL